MRGLILSHPAVAAVLAPYLVTWWEGHDQSVPQEILEIERQSRFRGHGNMQAYVLMPDGRVAGGFTPFPGSRPFDRDRGEPVEYFAARVTEFTEWMGLDPARAAADRSIKLPDVSSPGVRLFLTFRGEMNAHVPVVEVTKVPEPAWQALAHPGTAARTVDPALLMSWLEKIYPPAMMDQANQVERVTGKLELTPAGDTPRRAILSGEVTLVLAGSKAFVGPRAEPDRQFKDLPIPGRLAVLLEYAPGGGRPRSLRGWFQGSYVRPAPVRDPRPRAASTIFAAIEGLHLAPE